MSSKGISTAHSVVEPTATSKRIATTLVVLYALITLVPLVWILLTSIKSPPDSISYPPKVIFEPSAEGYCNLFTTRSRTEKRGRSKPMARVIRLRIAGSSRDRWLTIQIVVTCGFSTRRLIHCFELPLRSLIMSTSSASSTTMTRSR